MRKKTLLFGLLLLVTAVFLQGCVIAPPRYNVVSSPAGDEEYDEYAEIAYEQVYYTEPPPIIVGYPYRHWMYVRNGDFVDVIFVDYDGHQHIEHWNHGGRMTYDRAAGWHREQRRKIVAEKRQKSHMSDRNKPARVQTPRQQPTQEKPAQVQTPKQQPKPQPAKPAPKKQDNKKKQKDDKD
jgi:hypothetical protein